MIVGIDARLALGRGRGWGRYAAELIRELARCRDDGVELRVLLPDGREAQRLAGDIAGRLSVVTEPFAGADSPSYADRALEGSDPSQALGAVDMLHSLTQFVPRTRIPRILATIHDIAPLSVPPFKSEIADATRVALCRLSEQEATIIAVSAYTKRELCDRANFPAERILVIHEGAPSRYLALLEPDRLDGRHQHPCASSMPDRYILYVGGAGPNKNLLRLVEAVSLLRRHCGDVRLVLVGAREWGYDELVRQLPTTPASGSSWIEQRGFVEEEQLVDLYRHAAVVVLPSLHEGFGLPVLEAMALGGPVCCSRIPVLEEIGGSAAWYFEPHDAQDIARALLDVLGSADLARELRARGRQRASRFTWRETARQTLAAYGRIAPLAEPSGSLLS
jgi:alpha-1,3-rhamnosyl/mannosyltransferase